MVLPKILTLQGLLEIFHCIESANHKTLVADPKLEKSMAISQGIGKNSHSVVNYMTGRRRQHTVQMAGDKFSQKKLNI